MMTNEYILDFIKNNYLLILFVFISILRIIPPEWAGFWKYNNNKETGGRAPKISVIRFILHSVVDGILSSFLIPLLASFSLKNPITLVIIAIVSFNIFSEHQISVPAVSLVAIGITVLYLDRLIDTGKHIEVFGGILKWDKMD